LCLHQIAITILACNKEISITRMSHKMRSPKGYVVTPKVNAKIYISRLVYDLRAFSCLLDQVYDLLGLLERHALVKEKGVGDAGLHLLIYMMSNSQWGKFFL